MAIQNKEDAEKYLKDVRSKLDELTALSLDAGLNTHAAMWQSLVGIFYHSSKAIDNLITAVMIQGELLLAEMHDELRGDVEDDDF